MKLCEAKTLKDMNGKVLTPRAFDPGSQRHDVSFKWIYMQNGCNTSAIHAVNLFDKQSIYLQAPCAALSLCNRSIFV